MIKFRKIIRKISNFTRGTTYVIGTLFGIRWAGKEGWNCEPIIFTCLVFFFGTPVLMLFIGSNIFSLAGWLAITLGVLALQNLEDALAMLVNFTTYGVCGVIDEEEIGAYSN